MQRCEYFLCLLSRGIQHLLAFTCFHSAAAAAAAAAGEHVIRTWNEFIINQLSERKYFLSLRATEVKSLQMQYPLLISVLHHIKC